MGIIILKCIYIYIYNIYIILLIQVELTEFNNHVRENIVLHFDILHKKVQSLERNQRGLPKIEELERNVKRIEDTIRSLPVAGSRPVYVDSSAPRPTGGGASVLPNAQDMAAILEATGDKMAIYEGVITVLNREIEKLTLQVFTIFFV